MTTKWMTVGSPTAAGLGLLLLIGTVADVRAQDVSGDWDVRWAQAVRVESDGSVEVQAWGDAELHLVQDADRLTGTWTTHVLDGYVAMRFQGMRREPARHPFTAEPVGGA